MKKQIISPLCSAIVIPGMGQILNQQLKKGVMLLAAVFVLFIAGTVKLYFIMKSMVAGMTTVNQAMLTEKLKEQDLTVIWFIVAVFAVIWLYSVIDAFINGRKIDQNTQG